MNWLFPFSGWFFSSSSSSKNTNSTQSSPSCCAEETIAVTTTTTTFPSIQKEEKLAEQLLCRVLSSVQWHNSSDWNCKWSKKDLSKLQTHQTEFKLCFNRKRSHWRKEYNTKDCRIGRRRACQTVIQQPWSRKNKQMK